MIDIRIIREHFDEYKKVCERRGCPVSLDTILELDQSSRRLSQEVDALRAERNRLSKECQTNPAAREQVKALKVDLGTKENTLNELQDKLMKMLAFLPNQLADDVPNGLDDTDNVELRKVGTIPTFDFPVRDHQQLGELLDIIDTQRGAKVAQTGFYYWKGKGAQLAQALFFWTQQQLVNKGFTLFMTPCVAKERTLYGTGYLPFFADQTFNIKDTELALIGTSEQTLVGYHADDVLDGKDLPLCYYNSFVLFRIAHQNQNIAASFSRTQQFQYVSRSGFYLAIRRIANFHADASVRICNSASVTYVHAPKIFGKIGECG